MNRVASLSEKERNELFTLTAERRGMGTVAVVEKDQKTIDSHFLRSSLPYEIVIPHQKKSLQSRKQ